MEHDIEVSFPGGKRVDARVGDVVVHTDQPVELGGEGSAAAPFDLFLSSLATCAGFYVLAFCQARGLSTEGIRMRQHVELDSATKLPRRISIDIALPASFPEPYRAAIVRAAQSCKVSKTLASSPLIEVVATASDAAHRSQSPTS
ncbi:MAG TPA: OsmC family protein [Polyangiaceae bacterium]|jgi:ribosomal protein S12 methylthiotransferase accessory factor